MEEDILKYSPTVMFRGTPCIIKLLIYCKYINGVFAKKKWWVHNINVSEMVLFLFSFGI